MNIKNIQDQIENYATRVAMESYLLGMHYSIEKISNDEVHDKLLEIVKSKLEDK